MTGSEFARRQERHCHLTNSRMAGWLGNYRGRKNEGKAVRALRNLNGNSPEWFLHARRATRQEDAAGQDIVVYTTSGQFGLQIKSSQSGASKFFKQRLRNGYSFSIGVVVSLDGDTEEEVAERALEELLWLISVREQIAEWDRDLRYLHSLRQAGINIQQQIEERNAFRQRFYEWLYDCDYGRLDAWFVRLQQKIRRKEENRTTFSL